MADVEAAIQEKCSRLLIFNGRSSAALPFLLSTITTLADYLARRLKLGRLAGDGSQKVVSLLQRRQLMINSGLIPEKHFVLVHGACHGAWSWYKVVAMLRSSGHNVTALDLGASGINPLQALQIPHQSDYFRPLMLFMAALPSTERVILVAHSLGGLAISKAMETFPQKISVAVFVTAIMPGPSLNISTLTAQIRQKLSIISEFRTLILAKFGERDRDQYDQSNRMHSCTGTQADLIRPVRLHFSTILVSRPPDLLPGLRM
nr:salicylic acid-binding protein 2-like [Ipomoea batatas]